jgi:hypothetical protein
MEVEISGLGATLKVLWVSLILEVSNECLGGAATVFLAGE